MATGENRRKATVEIRVEKLNGHTVYSAWEPCPPGEHGEHEAGWGRVGTRHRLPHDSVGAALGKSPQREEDARHAEHERAYAAILAKYPQANGGVRQDGKITMHDRRLG